MKVKVTMGDNAQVILIRTSENDPEFDSVLEQLNYKHPEDYKRVSFAWESWTAAEK